MLHVPKKMKPPSVLPLSYNESVQGEELELEVTAGRRLKADED